MRVGEGGGVKMRKRKISKNIEEVNGPEMRKRRW